MVDLDQELTDESNESKFDVGASVSLIEFFDNLEHIDDIQPVSSWVSNILIRWYRLLKHELADEVNWVVLRVE